MKKLIVSIVVIMSVISCGHRPKAHKSEPADPIILDPAYVSLNSRADISPFATDGGWTTTYPTYPPIEEPQRTVYTFIDNDGGVDLVNGNEPGIVWTCHRFECSKKTGRCYFGQCSPHKKQ